ncbi:MAG: hypothetical protein A2015_13775 [Spirochaetes bacterium GWF1_31_7]|nr:MAG: hypothetical protein A2Y30_11050 [Spirochaetes bacterium GWE1_32_154]OHD46146.1 MAG: hypothetical protein A2Y29_08570 [Spirochaetes bacterium GWE2_31_10]OHD49887.1 MAG: hypothetical protein A2015_13775 [Spirochaetes bacterium GWF1_31_7]OHD78901.1 MAG: hypothetical protein A2355_01565 [Spirochaetes bacterium RIFOXYB1_FULL_32_8]HBD96284.1 hypothetical protein [Spirochaetia bacterium]
MGKIICHEKNQVLYIDFQDYEHKTQLKDFYKLFKKATGFTVSSYREEDENTIAVTDNTKNSLNIMWSPETGCCVFSNKEDVNEMVNTTFKMLCYRYENYKNYEQAYKLENIEYKEEAEQNSDIDKEVLLDVKTLIGF